MADHSKWDRKVNKLIRRQWAEVCEAWLGYIPTIDDPGTAPEIPLSDLPDVQATVKEAVDDHPKTVSTAIPGLRQGVLAEALFYLHKSASVLGSAQVHVARGLCSWSLSSAYHAAFFGMKAIIHLMGVAVIETGNSTYLVDVWGEPEKKKKQHLLGPQYSVLIQKVAGGEHHRSMWACFQRLLRVGEVPDGIWPTGCVDALKAHEIKAFARQRNDLHYTMTWPFKDLHSCLVQDAFGKYSGGLSDGEAVSDQESPSFSVALGLVLVRMGYRMTEDLVQRAPALKPELDLLTSWLANDCNHLYQAAYGGEPQAAAG